MDCKHRPAVALAVATLLMVVAVLENTVSPWAPFYVTYAVLASGLPFVVGAVNRSSLRRPSFRYAAAGVVLAVLLQGMFRVVTARVDLQAMFGQMLTVAAARLATRPESVATSYVIFIQAWAGFGEEVFYRGYLQRSLRTRFAPLPSIAGAALVFAVRHYAQLLLAWPHVAWASATTWVAATFVIGLALGWLYEKSASLWPSIVCHYLFNLLA
jgi:membrane protease YdiL (CAAX protease family)